MGIRILALVLVLVLGTLLGVLMSRVPLGLGREVRLGRT